MCAREKSAVIFKRKETLDSVDVSNCDNFGGEKMIGILFNLRGKILRRQCVPSHLFPARMVAKINKLRSLTASAFFFHLSEYTVHLSLSSQLPKTEFD